MRLNYKQVEILGICKAVNCWRECNILVVLEAMFQRQGSHTILYNTFSFHSSTGFYVHRQYQNKGYSLCCSLSLSMKKQEAREETVCTFESNQYLDQQYTITASQSRNERVHFTCRLETL